MTKYLIKRTISSIISLFLFLTFMFFVMQIMIPTDFTTQFSLILNRQQREQLKQELGIDRPLWERYLDWANRLLRGSLGTSFYGYPVVNELKRLIPKTLLIFLSGTTASFFFGQWLGKKAAWKGPGWFSNLTTFASITLYTSFPPLLAFLLTYFLGRRVNLFRAMFRGNALQRLDRLLWARASLQPEQVMTYMMLTTATVLGFLTLVNWSRKRRREPTLPLWQQLLFFVLGTLGIWFLFGFGRLALDILQLSILPILVFTLLSFGETMLIMRTSMQDTLQEYYITTAEAKGLPEKTIRDKHAARNALFPVLSRLVISIPYLLTGMVIVEDVLHWPGMSQALFESMYNQDVPVVMGALVIVGIVCTVTRLVLDILYAYLDPRIRYTTRSLEAI